MHAFSVCGPAASCTQLFAAGLSSNRVQSVHFDTYPILGGYPGNPCAFENLTPPTLQRHAGRAEFTSLMADPVSTVWPKPADADWRLASLPIGRRLW